MKSIYEGIPGWIEAEHRWARNGSKFPVPVSKEGPKVTTARERAHDWAKIILEKDPTLDNSGNLATEFLALEAESQTWGNEYTAVCVMKERVGIAQERIERLEAELAAEKALRKAGEAVIAAARTLEKSAMAEQDIWGALAALDALTAEEKK